MTNRIDCPHCEGKGSCLIDAGMSCGTCLKAAKVKTDSKIVKCEVCDGYGKIEPKSERLIARLPFIIVMVVLTVFYLYVGMNAEDDDKFDQIFPLVASLTTMIVTFYFSKK